MLNLCIEFSRKLERNPIRAILLFVAMDIGFLILTANVVEKWPNHANELAFIMVWVWLFWAAYLGVPILRYMAKKYSGN